jgi:hypothetical protein
MTKYLEDIVLRVVSAANVSAYMKEQTMTYANSTQRIRTIWDFKESLRTEGYELVAQVVELPRAFGMYVIQVYVENVSGLYSALAQSQEIDREAGEMIPVELIERTVLRALHRLKVSTGQEMPTHWRP